MAREIIRYRTNGDSELGPLFSPGDRGPTLLAGSDRVCFFPENVAPVELSPLAPWASGHFFSEALRARGPSNAVSIRQLLDPVVIRLAGGLLCTSDCDLVPWDPFVRGVPADLDLDRRLPLAQACYIAVLA